MLYKTCLRQFRRSPFPFEKEIRCRHLLGRHLRPEAESRYEKRRPQSSDQRAAPYKGLLPFNALSARRRKKLPFIASSFSRSVRSPKPSETVATQTLPAQEIMNRWTFPSGAIRHNSVATVKFKKKLTNFYILISLTIDFQTNNIPWID